MKKILVYTYIISLVACTQQTEPDAVDLGYDYFPSQIGATWIYQVDSLVYDDNSGFTTIDTFIYQYKEQITGTYINGSGKTEQLVNRYVKKVDTLNWEQLNTYTLLKTDLNAQKTIENIRFVKLVFPLTLNKKWDGNAYNSLGNEEYVVSAFNTSQTIGSSIYDNTLTVIQKNENNAVEEIKRAEIYARNIGLVYLISDSINTQVGGSRGFRYRLTLTSYTP
jgi:hypothetical protein